MSKRIQVGSGPSYARTATQLEEAPPFKTKPPKIHPPPRGATVRDSGKIVGQGNRHAHSPLEPTSRAISDHEYSDDTQDRAGLSHVGHSGGDLKAFFLETADFYKQWIPSSTKFASPGLLNRLRAINQGIEKILRHDLIAPFSDDRAVQQAMAEYQVQANAFRTKWGMAAHNYVRGELKKAEAMVSADIRLLPEHENAFYHIGQKLESLGPSTPQRLQTSKWRELVPGVYDRTLLQKHEERLMGFYAEYQKKAYIGEESQLWLLIWRSLKLVHNLRTHNKSPTSPVSYKIETDFLAQDRVNAIFKLIGKKYEPLYTHFIEELVGRYCLCVDQAVKAKATKAPGLGRYELAKLEACLSSKTVDSTMIPLLHKAVLRLSHLIDGPAILRRPRNATDLAEWNIETFPKFNAFVIKQGIKDALVKGIPAAADEIPNFVRFQEPEGFSQRSAYDYVYYPFPETRGHEIAASEQIIREMSEPGIHSDGPREELVRNVPPAHARNPKYVTPWARWIPLGPAFIATALSVMVVQKLRGRKYRRLARPRPQLTPRPDPKRANGDKIKLGVKKLTKEQQVLRPLVDPWRKVSKVVYPRRVRISVQPEGFGPYTAAMRIPKLIGGGNRGSTPSNGAASRAAGRVGDSPRGPPQADAEDEDVDAQEDDEQASGSGQEEDEDGWDGGPPTQFYDEEFEAYLDTRYNADHDCYFVERPNDEILVLIEGKDGRTSFKREEGLGYFEIHIPEADDLSAVPVILGPGGASGDTTEEEEDEEEEDEEEEDEEEEDEEEEDEEEEDEEEEKLVSKSTLKRRFQTEYEDGDCDERAARKEKTPTDGGGNQSKDDSPKFNSVQRVLFSKGYVSDDDDDEDGEEFLVRKANKTSESSSPQSYKSTSTRTTPPRLIHHNNASPPYAPGWSSVYAGALPRFSDDRNIHSTPPAIDNARRRTEAERLAREANLVLEDNDGEDVVVTSGFDPVHIHVDSDAGNTEYSHENDLDRDLYDRRPLGNATHVYTEPADSPTARDNPPECHPCPKYEGEYHHQCGGGQCQGLLLNLAPTRGQHGPNQPGPAGNPVGGRAASSADSVQDGSDDLSNDSDQENQDPNPYALPAGWDGGDSEEYQQIMFGDEMRAELVYRRVEMRGGMTNTQLADLLEQADEEGIYGRGYQRSYRELSGNSDAKKRPRDWKYPDPE